jgi:pimeloyl-ACP methyl ester carboxylesterase
MQFWKRPPGIAIIVLLAIGLIVLGLVAVRVNQVTRPAQAQPVQLDFEAMLMSVEDVSFPAVDGCELHGWLIKGDPALPAIILGHDLGQDKSTLVLLGIALSKNGFSVLLFDFRGHGASGSSRSTLGLNEKRDVLGAIDYLNKQDWLTSQHYGLFGVGMGAHASVLAAADRSSVKALVLDALYPDVGYRLVRETYPGWSFGVDYLGAIPRAIFQLLNRAGSDDQTAAETLSRLVGRDILLLAGETEVDLATEIRRLYEMIPEQVDADGNLEFLPRSMGQGLYGDNIELYQEKVTVFFASRLGQ